MSRIFEIAFQLGADLTNSFRSAFSEANNAMDSLIVAAGSLGAVVGLGTLVASVDDMSASLNKLHAQTGTTGTEMEGLEEVAMNLFRDNYGESFEDVTMALANIKQNMHDLDNGELERMTADALIFADTFDADINEITRAANNMMQNFGIESSKAMDLFAAGAQRGLNFSDEMLDNVAEYAPLFSHMGYSAEEYFGIMERGAKAGVYNLDYVNDVMKEFQIRVKDGSKATNEAMGGLSKETQSVWNEFLKGNGTVSDVASTVVSELKGMEDQVMANQIGVGLFGTKWEDLESTAMYAMLGTNEAMEGFEGKMEEINDLRFDSFGHALRGIGRILMTDLMKPIGDAVLPHLQTLAHFLSDNLPGAIDRVKSVMGIIGPVLAGLGAAFLTVFSHAKIIVPIMTFVKGLSAAGGVAAALGGPIGIAALAIAGLVTAAIYAWNNIDGFKDGVLNAFNWVKDGIFQTIETLKPYLMIAFTTIFDFIMNIIGRLTAFWEQNGSQIVSIVMGSLSTVFNVVSTLLTGVWNTFQTILPAILSIVSVVWEGIKLAISNAINLVLGVINLGLAILRGDWNGAWEAIKTTATSIMNNIIGFFQSINLFEVGKTIINGLINGIKSMGSSVLSAISSLVPEPIQKAAGGVMKALGLRGYAEGGIVTSPELAWIGEGGDTEAVIPWNNSQRSKDLWLQTGQAIGMVQKNNSILPNEINKSINPEQVVPQSAKGGSVIHIQFSPHYSVSSPEELTLVQQHAQQDKDDLLARLQEIQRDERRLAF